MAKCNKEPICNKFDVRCHQLTVHADQVTRESLADECFFSFHCAINHVMNHIVRQLVLQHAVEQAGKVCMKTFISRNQLIGESESWHHATFLQPIDGAECTTEQDPFHSSEGNQALGEAIFVVHPLQSPLGFLADRGHGLHCLEYHVPLSTVA